MLLTYFFLGLAFAIPELIVVFNWPWLKQFIERNPILELGFSLALSAFLGWAMGVQTGVTLAVANVVSTVITLAVYKLHIIEHAQACGRSYRSAKKSIIALYQEFSAIIHLVWKIVSAPFRAFAWMMRMMNKGAAMVTRRA